MGILFSKTLRGICLGLVFFLLPHRLLRAHTILFYYNSQDGTRGAILQCVAALRSAGDRVTEVDVRGENRDPSADDWGAFDQVWDMRYVDRDRDACGSGDPRAADYFDGRWRRKAAGYLDHCGRLFLGAEHYQLADRDEGIYRFLKETGAVGRGYDDCPPSTRGNSTTEAPAFYPVVNGLGPASFYGEYVGGIPRRVLTGTSFVETDDNWEGDDGVDRSVASGWKGGQLGGELRSPACARGRLFVVWDATMWTLWQKGLREGPRPGPPVWDDSSWFSWSPRPEEEEPRRLEEAKRVTRKFFPAVARWLGGGPCPCAGATAQTIPPSPPEVILQAVAAPAPPGSGPEPSVRLSPGTPPLAAAPGNTAAYSRPATFVFYEPPVNLYMRFKDGPGVYRLDILDGRGDYLKTVFRAEIETKPDAWASWDGTDGGGRLMPAGTYYAAFFKDGRPLRKIALRWISPPPP